MPRAKLGGKAISKLLDKETTPHEDVKPVVESIKKSADVAVKKIKEAPKKKAAPVKEAPAAAQASPAPEGEVDINQLM